MHSKSKSQIMHYVWLSSCFSFLSPVTVSHLSLFHDLEIFEQFKLVILYKGSQFEFV